MALRQMEAGAVQIQEVLKQASHAVQSTEALAPLKVEATSLCWSAADLCSFGMAAESQQQHTVRLFSSSLLLFKKPLRLQTDLQSKTDSGWLLLSTSYSPRKNKKNKGVCGGRNFQIPSGRLNGHAPAVTCGFISIFSFCFR